MNVAGTNGGYQNNPSLYFFFLDHQKLEREARICRLLKHPNIGERRGFGLETCTHKNTDKDENNILFRSLVISAAAIYLLDTVMKARVCVCACVCAQYLMMMYLCALSCVITKTPEPLSPSGSELLTATIRTHSLCCMHKNNSKSISQMNVEM